MPGSVEAWLQKGWFSAAISYGSTMPGQDAGLKGFVEGF